MTMTRNAINAMLATIAEVGDQGSPRGVLFAGLLTHDPDLNAADFGVVESAMVSAGYIRRELGCLYPTAALLEAVAAAKQRAEGGRQ